MNKMFTELHTRRARLEKIDENMPGPRFLARADPEEADWLAKRVWLAAVSVSSDLPSSYTTLVLSFLCYSGWMFA